jgi:plastocyanin
MIPRPLPRLIALLLLLPSPLGRATVAAATLEALVKDESGKPVEDAVVYVAGAAPGGRAAAATMDQVQQEFVPHVLPVEVGTPVNFPNRDNIRHHVYSFSSPKKFELPLYIGTPASPVVFDRPGAVVLGCNIHDWMLGYIFVVPGPAFAKTAADGRARIDNLAVGAHDVRVWHPRLKVATEATTRSVTLADGGPGETVFTIGLKREWRIPRPVGGRYDRQN